MVNLGLAAASTLIFLAFFEFVVFRTVLPGSDAPRNAYVNEVVRYAPHQTGIWRVRDDIAAPFSINAQGWNSPLADYSVDRVAGGSRIAFVGDSFVEALQVPVEASFAEGVARGMGAGRPPEAFRFAVSGAPLSQYVQMVEREVVRFRPDWIVVLLVHNDFDESFMFQPGRYTSSFLKFVVRDGRVVGEMPPAPWRPGLVEGLRRSALVRFFLYRWQIRPETVIDAILGPAHASGEPRFSANIDVKAVLSREADIRAATKHGFSRLAALARDAGASLLLVMDGDRRAIESGQTDSPALRLNVMAAEAAREQGVAFLDLQPVFAADWAQHRRTFQFLSDNHWNEHGHEVVAWAISRRLLEMPARP